MAELRVKGGRRYVAQLMRDRYHQKVRALHNHFQTTGGDLRTFTRQQFTSVFQGTDIVKSDLIQSLLDDEMLIEHWAFIRSKLRELAYLTDRRHTEEYALDLALGWITEEWIRIELDKQAGAPGTVRLIGIDSEREFATLTIRANADFEVTKKKRTVRIDLMVDFLGTWEKNGYVDLKRGKVGYMKRGEVDAVLGFDLNRSSFHLITTPQLDGLKFSANQAMGGNQTLNVPLPKPVRFDRLYRSL